MSDSAFALHPSQAVLERCALSDESCIRARKFDGTTESSETSE